MRSSITSKLIVYAQLFATAVNAHSVKRTEAKRLQLVQSLVLSPDLSKDAAPAQLSVTFALADTQQQQQQQQQVHLALVRNEDIYTQPITVHRIRADGSLGSSETARDGHLAYRGTASTSSNQTNPEDWARVSLHVDGGVPLLEGAYRVDGFEYHIQTDATYRRTRGGRDALLSRATDQPFNVVWRYVEDSNGRLAERGENESTCGLESLDYNNGNENNDNNSSSSSRSSSNNNNNNGKLAADSLERRQRGATGGGDTASSLIQNIGSTSGCPSTRAIALLGIATDCGYTAQFGSEQEIRRNILTQVNAASRVYEEAFNVELRVRNITIADAECPTGSANDDGGLSWNRACGAGLDIEGRLGEFSAWKAGFDDGTAAWSLLTPCSSGSTVGIAWIRSVCQPGVLSAGGGGALRSAPAANVVARTSAEWQVLAHELGHNFGAVHDCTRGCEGAGGGGQTTLSGQDVVCCPLSGSGCDAGGQFMMNPSVNARVTQFSPCSVGQVCSAWGRGRINTACLRGNEDVPTVSESVCGNGVVDEGEDCDCGGPEGCGDNPCCDPATCRFTRGSACDPATQRCCTAQCRLASAGLVCRESAGLCDPQEVCSGSSGDCPRDVQLPDGRACGDGGGGGLAAGMTCATGVCTSRAAQCSMLLTSNNSTDTVVDGGAAANVTAQACSSTGCALNCMQLDGASGQPDGVCQASQRFFRDGTPCGSGSRMCYSGTCRASSGGGGGGDGGDGGSWIQRNRTLFIVLCVVGGLVLVAAGLILCSCVRRFRRRRAVGAQQVRMAAAMRESGYGGDVGVVGVGGGDDGVVSQQAWQHRPAPPPPIQTPAPVSRTGSNLHRWA